MENGAGSGEFTATPVDDDDLFSATPVADDDPFAHGEAPGVMPHQGIDRRRRRRTEDAHRVGMALEVLTHYGVRVMHDRSVPGSDGVIEQVVIGNNGITVVRSARLMGRIRSTKNELFIGGVNATVLVNGLRSRVNTVRHLVGGEAEVQGAFALTRRRRDGLKFHGKIALGSPQALVDYLEQAHRAEPDDEHLGALAEELEGIFLPAAMLS